MPKSRRQPLEPRFWAKVRKSDGCWEWTGALNSAGYGWIGVGHPKTRAAHRVSWELHNGEIQLGQHVLHRCDNRRCVNPNHLFLGTNSDNIADKCAKGRQSRIRLLNEANPNCRISRETVEKIKIAHASGRSQRAVAREFGVAQQTVSKICTGKQRGVVFHDREGVAA